jgi:hypothetical protein
MLFAVLERMHHTRSVMHRTLYAQSAWVCQSRVHMQLLGWQDEQARLLLYVYV